MNKLFFYNIATYVRNDPTASGRTSFSNGITKCLRILTFTFLLFTLSGCYLHTSTTRLKPKLNISPAPFGKITSVEGVSGSTNYQVTSARGFRVKQTAGLLLNKQLVSTPNGYRAYLHVSGRITSEELNR